MLMVIFSNHKVRANIIYRFEGTSINVSPEISDIFSIGNSFSLEIVMEDNVVDTDPSDVRGEYRVTSYEFSVPETDFVPLNNGLGEVIVFNDEPTNGDMFSMTFDANFPVVNGYKCESVGIDLKAISEFVFQDNSLPTIESIDDFSWAWGHINFDEINGVSPMVDFKINSASSETVSSVPEPNTSFLICFGIVVLIGMVRKKECHTS